MKLRELACSALLALLVVLAQPLAAQTTGRLSGTVTSGQTSQPLASVQVTVEGTNRTAVTGQNGQYTIENVPAGTHAVRAYLIGHGMERQENVRVAAGATTTVNFSLRAQALSIEELVVTGVTSPTSLTRVPFSVAKVTQENLQVPATGSPIVALQGKVPGLQVARSSGQPGTNPSIQLRSATSAVRATPPLIVVDGVLQAAGSVDLESLDVESVEILKGPAAAGLYGSRAAGGVLQIRTRRGTDVPEGRTRLGARVEYGQNALLREVPLSNAHEFRVNAQGEYLNAQGQVVTTRAARTLTEARIQDQPYPGAIYDPIRQFYDPGNFSNYSLSMTHNAGKTRAYVSSVATRESGVLRTNDGLTGYNFRINVDNRPNDRLSLQFSAYHNRMHRDDLSGSPFQDLLLMPRDVNLLSRDSTGNYIAQPDPTAPLENPVWRQTSRDNNTYRQRTQAAASATFDPVRWFSLSGNVGYDRSDIRADVYVPKGTPIISGTDPQGSLDNSLDVADGLNGEIRAILKAGLGALDTRTVVAATADRLNQNGFTASGTRFVNRGVRDLDQAQDRTVSSYWQEIRNTGYYANTNLDYAGKYILDLSVRRDGSSLFGPDERWQNYYRASAAWRMAEEPWWPVSFINDFKPRFSRGTAGNLPNYSYQYETYTVSSTGAIAVENLGNRALKPERATENELGLDVIALNRRMSLQLSYVTVRTEDQIVQLPPKGATGFFSQWANAGAIKGKSYEASLEAQLLQRRDLSWTATLVADRSTNVISDWRRSCYVSGFTYRCQGYSTSLAYGRRHLTSLDQLPSSAAPFRDQFAVNDDGYVVWVGNNPVTAGLNRNAAGQLLWNTTGLVGGVTYAWGRPIQQLDSLGAPALVKIGDGNPDFHWGLTNNVRLGRFTIFGVLDSQLGQDVYNFTKQRMYQYFRHADVDQTGKPDELKKPIDYYTTLYNAANTTEHFVEDGSFVKLRELSVNYSVRSDRFRLLRSIGADRASFGLIGRNLYTWTRFTGYDPEVGGIGTLADNFVYPNYRTVTAVVDFSF